MSQSTLIRRYAQALSREASSENMLETVDEDVAGIRESLSESRELRNFFQSPVISREKKQDVVRALFQENIAQLTLDFIQLLIRKEREDMLQPILKDYAVLRDEQRGIVEVKARVASPLDDDVQDRLIAELEQITGQQIRLNTTVDSALLGGLIIRIGDKVYDGSVQHQLNSLRERMVHGVSLQNSSQQNGQPSAQA